MRRGGVAMRPESCALLPPHARFPCMKPAIARYTLAAMRGPHRAEEPIYRCAEHDPETKERWMRGVGGLLTRLDLHAL